MSVIIERIRQDGDRFVPHRQSDGLFRVKNKREAEIAVQEHELVSYIEKGFFVRMVGEKSKQRSLIAASSITIRHVDERPAEVDVDALNQIVMAEMNRSDDTAVVDEVHSAETAPEVDFDALNQAVMFEMARMDEPVAQDPVAVETAMEARKPVEIPVLTVAQSVPHVSARPGFHASNGRETFATRMVRAFGRFVGGFAATR